MGKRHKFGAVATVVDGVKFPSKAEARRYAELKLLEKAGRISDLELQPKFELLAGFPGAIGFSQKVGKYVADFRYETDAGVVVEDVKGFDTPLSRWKRKHVKAQYGIDVQIVQY